MYKKLYVSVKNHLNEYWLILYFKTKFIRPQSGGGAAAKSLPSCPTLCDPMDSSPPGYPVPGILQARTLEWVTISFSNASKWKVKVKSLSHVWPSATPWMGFSRQEYWSGVPLPSLQSGARKFILHTSVSPSRVLKTVKLLQEMVNTWLTWRSCLFPVPPPSPPFPHTYWSCVFYQLIIILIWHAI